MRREGSVGVMCRWMVAMVASASALGASKAKPPPRPAPILVLSTRPAVEKLPVPEISAQVAAGVLIRETFSREFSAPDPAQRRSFARKLISQGLETSNDPAARYVLFREARDIAAAAGDVRTACRAVEMLDRHFLVEELRLTQAALAETAATAQTPQGSRAIAAAAFSAAQRAVAADDFDMTFRLLSLASSAAGKSRDGELRQEAESLLGEIKALAEQFRQVAAARQALQKDPDDAEANLLVGQYLCCANGNFAGGVPLLARSGDGPLAKAARLELSANLDEPEERMQAANAWWDLSADQPALARRAIEAHACEIYRQLLPKLAGLSRSLAEKRLETLDAQEVAAKSLQPGLRAELFKGVDFSSPAGSRVDGKIDFDWGLESPDPLLPKDNFSLRWSGVLRVPAGGRHEIIAIANQGARVWIDERLVIDGPNLARSRSGQRVPVELSPGLHDLRVEYWDTTGLARMRLLWKPPGASEQPIPESCFYHEAE